jgi:hypothetical protein
MYIYWALAALYDHPLSTSHIRLPSLTYARAHKMSQNMDTLGIEPNTSPNTATAVLRERDNQLHHVPFKVA